MACVLFPRSVRLKFVFAVCLGGMALGSSLLMACGAGTPEVCSVAQLQRSL